MVNEINPLEKKQQKQRYIYSSIIAFIIYIIIVALLLIFFINNEDKEEVTVIQVKLKDKIDERFDNMSNTEKEKYSKKQEESKEKFKRQIEKKKKQIQKEIEKQKSSDNKFVIEKNDVKENLQENNKENVNKNNNLDGKKDISDNKLPENKDLLEEYEKKLLEEKKSQEEEFFSEGKESETDTDDNNELDKLEEDLAFLDDALENLDSNNSSDNTSNNDSSNDSDDSNIKWEGGNKRKLIYRSNIIIPEKFSRQGLKTKLKIRFWVMKNGLISRAEIIVSSGDPELDNIVMNQFKTWKFEPIDNDVIMSGVIEEINISY